MLPSLPGWAFCHLHLATAQSSGWGPGLTTASLGDGSGKTGPPRPSQVPALPSNCTDADAAFPSLSLHCYFCEMDTRSKHHLVALLGRPRRDESEKEIGAQGCQENGPKASSGTRTQPQICELPRLVF